MPEDPAYAEIRALRERLARLEEVARATPPRAGLADAIGDHYSPTRPPPDRKHRDLVNRAHGFVPDLQMEAALAARARDPGTFDRQRAEMRCDPFEVALYADARAAAIELGLYHPEGDAA